MACGAWPGGIISSWRGGAKAIGEVSAKQRSSSIVILGEKRQKRKRLCGGEIEMAQCGARAAGESSPASACWRRKLAQCRRLAASGSEWRISAAASAAKNAAQENKLWHLRQRKHRKTEKRAARRKRGGMRSICHRRRRRRSRINMAINAKNMRKTPAARGGGVAAAARPKAKIGGIAAKTRRTWRKGGGG